VALSWKQLCKLGQALPEVSEDFWYGTPGLKVRGKGFVRLKEDGRSVVFMLESVDEQEYLCESQPDLYFITDHYRRYASVLARLAALPVPAARLRLERAWRMKAPAALVKQWGAAPAPPSTRKARPRGRTRSATSDRGR
jgi:hypothetical protein